MRSHRQSIVIRIMYILLDLGCIYLAFYLACFLRPLTLPFQVTVTNLLSSLNPFKLIVPVWALAILFFNQTHGLYQTKREMLESTEIWRVARSIFYAALVVIVCAYLFKIQDFPRSVMMIAIGFMIVFLSLWRMLKKLLVDYLVSQGYNNFNALVVGAGKVGTMLAREIKRRPSLGIRVVGFLDDFKTDKDVHTGFKVLGRLNNFSAVAKRHFINKLFITIHHDADVFLKTLEDARELGIAVHVVPQGFEFLTQDFNKYNIGIVPILEYSDTEAIHRHRGKRIFDFLMAALLLMVLWPFFMVIAFLIKCDSPGGVFYLSKRYGRRGEMFNMYKFRSMVVDAEGQLAKLKELNEVGGPIFKMKKDPRVTRMGAWLRKYSLDELPQILNVLKGDMSLVGPRPLPIEQVEKDDFRQLKRLDIRPGITGLWQISGRSDVSFDRLVRWDIWYINNWSFSLDFYILFQTIPVVLKAKGAY